MYDTSRHICPWTTLCGLSHRGTCTTGAMYVIRNIATLAMMMALMAGVHGPGPKEYASVDEDGYRDRIDPVCSNYAVLSNFYALGPLRFSASAAASRNSRMRRKCAATASTKRAVTIVNSSRPAWRMNVSPRSEE